MAGIYDWLSTNGLNVLIGSVLTGLILLIFNPVRDAIFRSFAGFVGWLRAIVLGLPSYLELRAFVRSRRPIWAFRKGTKVSNPNGPPVLTVMNFKGGVGKTTIAANLAAALSRERLGYRVLLVDLDYQGSLSDLLRVRMEGSENLVGDLLRNARAIKSKDQLVSKTLGLDRVDIVTAEYGLTDVEDNEMMRWMMNDTRDDARSRLARTLRSGMVKVWEHYDVVIMDAPPRLSLASVNALKASNFVLIPTKLQPLSVRPISKMLNYLEMLQRRIRSNFEILGVVCNMTRMDREPSGSENLPYEEIIDALAAQAPTAKIYTQFVKDTVHIGRPEGANIGYLLPGAPGDIVRATFDNLAQEIAIDLRLNKPLANAAE
ncbi:ParA family protein [Henriciella sp. AS95]|uniref:ParA family protein n=1 Tax=Henriciella sp. AS95 TaxID=3135782 RepID=UPI003178A9F3